MVAENKNLVKAGLASIAIHVLVVALGLFNIFEQQVYEDISLNIELAGASELQQTLDDYSNRPIVEELNLGILQSKESESEIKPKLDEIPEDQLVRGPSIVEPKLEFEVKKQSEESERALPLELKNEETPRSEKEKFDKERAKKDELRKKKEVKQRVEEKRKKEKKKKDLERRRKTRLEAIKKLEKKKNAKKRRLAKIADVVRKNNKAKKNDTFSQMLKHEKKAWSSLSNGSGRGNGLGSYGDGMGFVNSDAAIISNQIIPHWVVAGGVKNAETLIIRVRIKVKDNGEVPASSIEILDKDRYNSDSVFRSAADSAKRAILKASPLKIPAGKMHLFRDFEINFNTDKALGVNR